MVWFRTAHTGRLPKKKDHRNSHLSIIYSQIVLAIMGWGWGWTSFTPARQGLWHEQISQFSELTFFELWLGNYGQRRLWCSLGKSIEKRNLQNKLRAWRRRFQNSSCPRGQVTSPSGSGCIQSQMPCSKSSAVPLPWPSENSINLIVSALT